ncbi:uncharacterized protein LOC129250498 [Anastrepha obliqua]|uniref:uncharacterized protein LOC129250498 n=1 Tax=Anastrepha obliqua TaxID=95512 RepID=UPI0024099BFD|nr:uncharacterized protein LOC129250498 [Anastrepha obliqua]
MKDIGPVKTCLAIEFHQDLKKHSVFLNQREYAEQILKRFNMEDYKSVKTPPEFNAKLEKPAAREENEMKKYPYQSVMGALLYLAVTTRPDLASSINFLSQFNSNYNKTHWKAAKRVLRYLKGTINYGIFYEEGNAKLYAIADADLGTNMADKRSSSNIEEGTQSEDCFTVEH